MSTQKGEGPAEWEVSEEGGAWESGRGQKGRGQTEGAASLSLLSWMPAHQLISQTQLSAIGGTLTYVYEKMRGQLALSPMAGTRQVVHGQVDQRHLERTLPKMSTCSGKRCL